MNSYNQVTLKFDGSFIKEDGSITARTLGHSLSSLQRMVDKAVLFEQRGRLKKYDSLPSSMYELADLTVQPFEDGSLIVPLRGLGDTDVVRTLQGLLKEPFDLATSEQSINERGLIAELPNAINQARYRQNVRSHEEVIEDTESRIKRYFAEAIFKEFNGLISPLRSRSSDDGDIISIELRNELGAKEYSFNKSSSKRFSRIVSQKYLGPIISFRGRLKVFGESNSKHFPYFGQFLSNASKREHKLLIATSVHIDKLKEYNVSSAELCFLGSPVSSWGTFDEQRGDIVFLIFDEQPN